MRIIKLHNWHRFEGGQETVVLNTLELLIKNRHDVILEIQDSRKLGVGYRGKIRAFLCGIYCSSSQRSMGRLIKEFNPDLVHVHELYPFFSPWVLVECRRSRIPVIMTCHDFRFTCPIMIHWRKGNICRLCERGNEHWCVFKNCRSNILESLSYAMRSFIARKLRLLENNVSRYIAPSQFVKKQMIIGGVQSEKISVIPNMITIPDAYDSNHLGSYIAFVGRITPAKGIKSLLESARTTGIPIHLAGDYSEMADLVKEAPLNVKFEGHLNRDQLSSFYRNARCLVVPSTSYECSPVVIAEAMSYGLPVIASKIGGIPELVDDGITGILFDPNNTVELADKMRLIWEDPILGKRMGLAGRKKAILEYTTDVHYNRLLHVYEGSIEKSRLLKTNH
jgi:glycosyltransferase involved in cell wall biosynthesis